MKIDNRVPNTIICSQCGCINQIMFYEQMGCVYCGIGKPKNIGSEEKCQRMRDNSDRLLTDRLDEITLIKQENVGLRDRVYELEQLVRARFKKISEVLGDE